MANPRLIRMLRIAAALCSFGLIAVYVSCRAAGQHEKQADSPAAISAPPEPSPAVFPGSKSAEIEVWPSQSPPQPGPVQQPAPRQRDVVPSTKSAPVYPR